MSLLIFMRSNQDCDIYSDKKNLLFTFIKFSVKQLHNKN